MAAALTDLAHLTARMKLPPRSAAPFSPVNTTARSRVVPFRFTRPGAGLSRMSARYPPAFPRAF